MNDNEDEFGIFVASGDFDSNGISDLVVGSPKNDLEAVGDAGLVYVGTFADSDGDGLPDVVEEEFGTDPQDADSDGDGMDDGEERVAGTDPLDSTSSIRITEVAYDFGLDVFVRWMSVPGRSYGVERSMDGIETQHGPVYRRVTPP